MSSRKESMIKLNQNGSNYKNWWMLTQHILAENGIFNVKTVSDKWKGIAVDQYHKQEHEVDLKREATAKKIFLSSIHNDHCGYLDGKNAEEMRSILENKFGKVNQESRLERILKFFQWKKNDDNYISYFSKKRTMYSDLNSGMKTESLYPKW